MFSRTAVTNSLLTKLIPKKPEAKVPIEQLEKRLNLLGVHDALFHFIQHLPRLLHLFGIPYRHGDGIVDHH